MNFKKLSEHSLELIPKKPAKHLIEDGLKTFPMYLGKKHSIKEVVNSDGTVNIKNAKKIMEDIASYFGGKKMQNRAENPVWHKTDPNTWLHTKLVAQNAWQIPVPEGYTKQDLMVAVLGHDFGKMLSGDGHAEVSYNLIRLIFPDASPQLLEAIRRHMDPILELVKGTAKLEGSVKLKQFEEFGKNIKRYKITDAGKEVGEVEVILNPRNKTINIGSVYAEKGKGYGQKTYEAISKQFPEYTLVSDPDALSNDAIKMWDSLVGKNKAIKRGDKDYQYFAEPDKLMTATKFADLGVTPTAALETLGLTPEELEIVKLTKWFKKGGSMKLIPKAAGGKKLLEDIFHKIFPGKSLKELTPEEWDLAYDYVLKKYGNKESNVLLKIRDYHFYTAAPDTVVKETSGKPLQVFHGGTSPSIRKFSLDTPNNASLTNTLDKRIYFSDSKGIASQYAVDPEYKLALTIDHLADAVGLDKEGIEIIASRLKMPVKDVKKIIKDYEIGLNFIVRKTNEKDFIYPAYLNIRKHADIDLDGEIISRLSEELRAKINAEPAAIIRNVDETVSNLYGMRTAPSTDYLVLYPQQIKRSAAITYDTNGNIIPISLRDNFYNPDINFKKGGNINYFSGGGITKKTMKELELFPEIVEEAEKILKLKNSERAKKAAAIRKRNFENLPEYEQEIIQDNKSLVKKLKLLTKDIEASQKAIASGKFIPETKWDPEEWLLMRKKMDQYDPSLKPGESYGKPASPTNPKGYTIEDIEIFKTHIPELLAIEYRTKKNGTWMKNSDGSIYDNDPRIWLMWKLENIKHYNPTTLYSGMHSDYAANFMNYKGRVFATENPGTYFGNTSIPFRTSTSGFELFDAGGRTYDQVLYEKGRGVSTDSLLARTKGKGIIVDNVNESWADVGDSYGEINDSSDLFRDYAFNEGHPRWFLWGNTGNFNMGFNKLGGNLIPKAQIGRILPTLDQIKDFTRFPDILDKDKLDVASLLFANILGIDKQVARGKLTETKLTKPLYEAIGTIQGRSKKSVGKLILDLMYKGESVPENLWDELRKSPEGRKLYNRLKKSKAFGQEVRNADDKIIFSEETTKAINSSKLRKIIKATGKASKETAIPSPTLIKVINKAASNTNDPRLLLIEKVFLECYQKNKPLPQEIVTFVSSILKSPKLASKPELKESIGIFKHNNITEITPELSGQLDIAILSLQSTLKGEFRTSLPMLLENYIKHGGVSQNFLDNKEITDSFRKYFGETEWLKAANRLIGDVSKIVPPTTEEIALYSSSGIVPERFKNSKYHEKILPNDPLYKYYLMSNDNIADMRFKASLALLALENGKVLGAIPKNAKLELKQITGGHSKITAVKGKENNVVFGTETVGNNPIGYAFGYTNEKGEFIESGLKIIDKEQHHKEALSDLMSEIFIRHPEVSDPKELLKLYKEWVPEELYDLFLVLLKPQHVGVEGIHHNDVLEILDLARKKSLARSNLFSGKVSQEKGVLGSLEPRDTFYMDGVYKKRLAVNLAGGLKEEIPIIEKELETPELFAWHVKDRLRKKHDISALVKKAKFASKQKKGIQRLTTDALKAASFISKNNIVLNNELLNTWRKDPLTAPSGTYSVLNTFNNDTILKYGLLETPNTDMVSEAILSLPYSLEFAKSGTKLIPKHSFGSSLMRELVPKVSKITGKTELQLIRELALGTLSEKKLMELTKDVVESVNGKILKPELLKPGMLDFDHYWYFGHGTDVEHLPSIMLTGLKGSLSDTAINLFFIGNLEVFDAALEMAKQGKGLHHNAKGFNVILVPKLPGQTKPPKDLWDYLTPEEINTHIVDDRTPARFNYFAVDTTI